MIEARIPRLMIVTRGLGDLEIPDALAAEVMIQLRDKQASGAELEARARRLAARAVLSINVGGARIDWRRVGARFVHLPERAPPAGDLPWGRSVHSVEAARREAPAAAYLVAGPVWATPGKPDALGIESLEAICQVAGDTPVFAIGGILEAAQVRAAMEAGAHGVAGIRAFAGPRLAEFGRQILRS